MHPEMTDVESLAASCQRFRHESMVFWKATYGQRTFHRVRTIIVLVHEPTGSCRRAPPSQRNFCPRWLRSRAEKSRHDSDAIPRVLKKNHEPFRIQRGSRHVPNLLISAHRVLTLPPTTVSICVVCFCQARNSVSFSVSPIWTIDSVLETQKTCASCELSIVLISTLVSAALKINNGIPNRSVGRCV